tara:strand:+ start:449 stop:760 length:312 start_codon:yes stop_codon:yes gene_type:complete
MVLVTPFSTYLSSEDYVQMNESFINLSFTPTEIMFIGVVALFVFIIFGGKNDDEEEYESLNIIKPMVNKFDDDEDLGQYIRALSNASYSSKNTSSSTRKKTKK